ncbi:hypothetical protein M5689_000879 [Euphorbia peplus]|nr:hypothetical protein M5689_000879 [Euphorbia peplus]
MAKFGYFRDLPEILYRIVEGSNVRKNQLIEEEENNLYKHNRKMKMSGHGRKLEIWKNLKDAVTKEQARLNQFRILGLCFMKKFGEKDDSGCIKIQY